MKREHLLIAVAWVATVAVAYFVGSGIESSKTQGVGGSAAGAQQQAGAGGNDAQAQAHGQHAFVRKFDEFDDGSAPGSKPNVAALVARARQQFSSSGMGMMNIRGMLRAMAPFADLDDAQLQDALGEVEKTVKEPQAKMMLYSILLGQWAETDGKAALAYADSKLGGSGSPMDFGVRASVIGTWAQRDPDGAWRWFQTERKDDGNDRTKGMLVSMMFAGMASNDLDGTLQKIATLDDQSKMMAISGIANSANTEGGRKRLLDRALTLPDDQKLQIRQGVVQQWAMMDADAAMKWIHALPAAEQKPMRDSAANTILMMQPAKGADLLMEGASEEDKPRLYDRVVGQWAWQDQKAAGEWLSKQSQGPELDNARRTYAMAVSQKDPAAAMDWAKSVQTPDQRTQSVEQIFQQWRVKDAAAAEAALDASGVSAEDIKRMKSAQVPKVQGTSSVRLGF